jgi:hypothetical protein
VQYLIVNIVVGVFVTPLYIAPMGRVILSSSRPTLDATVLSFCTFEDTICCITMTKPVVCTCTLMIGQHLSRQRCFCVKSVSGCLTCMMYTDNPRPSLPMSFVCCVACVWFSVFMLFLLFVDWVLNHIYI